VQAGPGQGASELMENGRAALVEAKNTLDAHYAWFVEEHVPNEG
jgi:hypothetical protein